MIRFLCLTFIIPLCDGFSLKTSVNIGDIVEFILPDSPSTQTTSLGIILSSSNDLCIQPLCIREGDDDIMNEKEITFTQDESKESLLVHPDQIQSVIEDVYFSQRPIEDRILNPHGEHSEDVYLIRTSQLDLNRLFFSKEGKHR